MGRGRLPPPNPSELLAGFLEKMTPAQREHAKLYPAGLHSLFRDGGLSMHTSDSLGMWSSGEPPTQSLVDAMTVSKCKDFDAIFAGVVTGAVSNPNETGTFIFTDYTVKVTDWLSTRGAPGKTPAEAIVTRPGGSLRLPDRTVISVTAEAYEPIDLQSEVVFFGRFVPETGAFRSSGVFDEFPIVRDLVRVRHVFVKDDIPAGGLPRKSFFITIRNIPC